MKKFILSLTVVMTMLGTTQVSASTTHHSNSEKHHPTTEVMHKLDVKDKHDKPVDGCHCKTCRELRHKKHGKGAWKPTQIKKSEVTVSRQTLNFGW